MDLAHGRQQLQGQAPSLDLAVFRQHGEFLGRKPSLAAEDVLVVLADERCPSENTSGRAIVDGALAWGDEAAAQLRVLHLLPETTIVQMGVV
jgi:hypothetical protein